MEFATFVAAAAVGFIVLPLLVWLILSAPT